jgi:hypothetical protein
LATVFPGGTARFEIRRRVVIRTENGEITSNAQAAVMQELVDELAGYVIGEIRESVQQAVIKVPMDKGEKKDASGSSSRASMM